MNIQQLAQQMERQKKLLAVQQELTNQLRTLEAQVTEARAAWTKEQKDVDRLNRLSLASLFYDLLGNKEEKMEQEHREAMAAAAKYQAAKAELDRVTNELRLTRNELDLLDGCEQRYRQACDDRAQVLKSTDPVIGRQIMELEEESARVCAQLRELREAISAGELAESAANEVLRHLDSAEGWGTFDLFSDGILADIAKHDRLDQAQSAIHRLQARLSSYKTELVDVRIQADLGLNISDFLRFSDWFFDNIFTDWAMQDKIHDAQNRTLHVLNQITAIQTRLQTMEQAFIHQRQSVQDQIDKLVIG